MKLREAYKMVLKDLSKWPCKDKDYCIGCYGCGMRLIYKTLKSHYDFEFNSKVIIPKKN